MQCVQVHKKEYFREEALTNYNFKLAIFTRFKIFQSAEYMTPTYIYNYFVFHAWIVIKVSLHSRLDGVDD